MDTSRKSILDKIKKGKPIGPSLPVIPGFPGPEDKEKSFKEKLAGFSGSFHDFKSKEEALKWLAENRQAMKKPICSVVGDFEGDISLGSIRDPHAANVIATFVAEGELGVGECGSVWVTDRSLGMPAAALFSIDLILFLDRNKIMGSLHEAYDKIELGQIHYGSFYSGPSATADIEAVHITGAQAEISLTVLIYG